MRMSIVKSDIFVSEDLVKAFGNIELEENETSQVTNVSVWQLKEVIQILEAMGLDKVSIRVQNDFPLFITNEKKEGKLKTNGLMIAPIIRDD